MVLRAAIILIFAVAAMLPFVTSLSFASSGGRHGIRTALTPGDGYGSGWCANHGSWNLGSNFENIWACANSNAGWSPYDDAGFQCVELVNRYLWLRTGFQIASGTSGAKFVQDAHALTGLPIGVPGTNIFPLVGDIVSMSGAGTDPFGHTGIVTDVSQLNPATGTGTITVEDENGGSGGTTNITLNNWVEASADSGYYHYTNISWLEITPSTNSGGVAVRPNGSGYTVNGQGVITAFGGAPQPIASATWPQQDVVRGIVLLPDGLSGYVLDKFGGLHPFTTAGHPMPSQACGGPYWNGWDIARAVVMIDGQAQGYILDGFGSLHPFAECGTALPPNVHVTGYWSGWDIARGVSLIPGQDAGVVIDGFGALHPFAGPGYSLPVITGKPAPYWGAQRWDIARGVTLISSGQGVSGYTLDGYGGVHEFGFAPKVTTTGYWPPYDVARGIAVTDRSNATTVLGRYENEYTGVVATFWHAPPPCSTCK